MSDSVVIQPRQYQPSVSLDDYNFFFGFQTKQVLIFVYGFI